MKGSRLIFDKESFLFVLSKETLLMIIIWKSLFKQPKKHLKIKTILSPSMLMTCFTSCIIVTTPWNHGHHEHTVGLTLTLPPRGLDPGVGLRGPFYY